MARQLYLQVWGDTACGYKVAAMEESEGKPAKRALRFHKRLKSVMIVIPVSVVVIIVLSRRIGLPVHWCSDEIAPLAGTLFLAVGVVLVANYLSGGRQSRQRRRGRI